LTGLPYLFRNKKIGILIYKHLIFKYGYISSFAGYKPSEYSKMVWYTLASDNELYFFNFDNNFLVMKKDIEKSKILDILKKFYSQLDLNSS